MSEIGGTTGAADSVDCASVGVPASSCAICCPSLALALSNCSCFTFLDCEGGGPSAAGGVLDFAFGGVVGAAVLLLGGTTVDVGGVRSIFMLDGGTLLGKLGKADADGEYGAGSPGDLGLAFPGGEGGMALKGIIPPGGE